MFEQLKALLLLPAVGAGALSVLLLDYSPRDLAGAMLAAAILAPMHLVPIAAVAWM